MIAVLWDVTYSVEIKYVDREVLLDQSFNACQTSIEYSCVFFLQRRLAGWPVCVCVM